MLKPIQAARMSSEQDLINHIKTQVEEIELYAQEGQIRQQYAKGMLEAYGEILTGLYAIQENRKAVR